MLCRKKYTTCVNIMENTDQKVQEQLSELCCKPSCGNKYCDMRATMASLCIRNVAEIIDRSTIDALSMAVSFMVK
jgi:hypothetical protein